MTKHLAIPDMLHARVKAEAAILHIPMATHIRNLIEKKASIATMRVDQLEATIPFFSIITCELYAQCLALADIPMRAGDDATPIEVYMERLHDLIEFEGQKVLKYYDA